MQAILPLFATKIVYERACPRIRTGVPGLRLRQARNDAERRLSVLLRMCWLQDPAASKVGGLLRFLFLRVGKVSTDAGRELHHTSAPIVPAPALAKSRDTVAG
jgi:hypothetical protein